MNTKSVGLLAVGVCFSLMTLAGCALTREDNPVMTDAAATATVPGPGMYKTSDLVFQYRQQAADLRELARQLEVESAFYAQQQDQEQAKRKRELAQEALSAADTADQRARDYRRQLPHGQIY